MKKTLDLIKDFYKEFIFLIIMVAFVLALLGEY